jgi:uncharacterized cupredoxin-like copper-binding protein
MGASTPRETVGPLTAMPGAVVLILVAVAALMAAGCGGDGGGGASTLPAVDAGTSPRLEVRASEMTYAPDAVAVAAGSVEVVLHNDGAVLHDLRIGDEPFVIEAVAGQSATRTIALEPGRYEMYCSIPGHRQAGMEGVLEVR